MQWIAMITMLIDHIGVVFFPDYIIFRLIGRIAFPLYAYLAVLGYQRTTNFRNYFIRLVILALIAQLPFQLAFNTIGINVIGTLAISIAVIKCIDHFRHKPWLFGSIVILAALVLDSFPFDYGMYGLILMIIYRYLLHKPSIALLAHLALEIFSLTFYKWGIQSLSVLVTLYLIYNQQGVKFLDRIRAPKWLWRLFYPIHLIILYIIVRFM